MKYSLRRINQLGYFKPLDDAALDVKKVSNTDDQVDVTISVEEQNRNQLQFGAGMSQYEGVFGNLSFTTANLFGGGRSLTVAAQAGTRSRNYQLSFTEPFAFSRAMSIGSSLYSRKVDFATTATTIDYSEVRSGANVTSGMAWRRFTRLFLTYGYEIIDTAMTDELSASLNGAATGGAVLTQEGRFTESSVTPSLVYNTVDNPFAPRPGHAAVCELSIRRRLARRHEPFRAAGPARHPLRAADAPDGDWHARQCRRHLEPEPTGAALLPAVFPRRRTADSRGQRPHGRAAQRNRRRHRRHSLCRLQRRALLRPAPAGARAALSRRPARPSARARPSICATSARRAGWNCASTSRCSMSRSG